MDTGRCLVMRVALLWLIAGCSSTPKHPEVDRTFVHMRLVDENPTDSSIVMRLAETEEQVALNREIVLDLITRRPCLHRWGERAELPSGIEVHGRGHEKIPGHYA